MVNLCTKWLHGTCCTTIWVRVEFICICMRGLRIYHWYWLGPYGGTQTFVAGKTPSFWDIGLVWKQSAVCTIDSTSWLPSKRNGCSIGIQATFSCKVSSCRGCWLRNADFYCRVRHQGRWVSSYMSIQISIDGNNKGLNGTTQTSM